jgi:prevent-host-death family protein
MRKVSAVQARRHFSALVKQVQSEPVLVTRHGQPAGYVLSPADFKALVEGGDFSTEAARRAFKSLANQKAEPRS